MTKVHVITDRCKDDFVSKVNDFIRLKDVIDIKYTTVGNSCIERYSCLIIYKEDLARRF